MKKYFLLSLSLLCFSITAYAGEIIVKGDVEAVEVVNTFAILPLANMHCSNDFSRCGCRVELSTKGDATPPIDEYGSTSISLEIRPKLNSGNITIDTWVYFDNDSGKYIVPVATTTPFESEQKCKREVNNWIGKDGKEFQHATLFYRLRK